MLQASREEDPHHCGLVLEWVYGSIVPTAEKARDSAHRALSAQLAPAEEALLALMTALGDQAQWELRLQEARSTLAEVLRTRREAHELARHHDLRNQAMVGMWCSSTQQRAQGIQCEARSARQQGPSPWHTALGWLSMRLAQGWAGCRALHTQRSGVVVVQGGE